MKVKTFAYEKNWTGKYYRQRLLPTMQTMDRHMASMLNDGWEVMSETSHSGNNLGLLHRQQRRMEEARKECQGALKIDPDVTEKNP